MYIPGVYTEYMSTNQNIKAGTEFRILLGMPRTGKITKVTRTRVFYNTVASNGEVIPEITTRAMFDNAAMVEVI